MTCPFCQHEIEAPRPVRCPECGGEFVRHTSGLIKTSAVLIAADDKRTVYRSVQEVPEPWRGRLIESTNSRNSATIVIADHGGRKHIADSVRRSAEAQQQKPAPVQPIAQSAAVAPQPEALATSRTAWSYAVAILLLLFLLASVWLVSSHEW